MVKGQSYTRKTQLMPRLYSKRWFGFAEVDIEVPQDLCEEFEEFPPIFINQSIGVEGVPQHMKDYLAKSSRSAMPCTITLFANSLTQDLWM